MPSKSLKSLKHNYNEYLDKNTALDHRSHRSKSGRKPPTRDWAKIQVYKQKLNNLQEEELNNQIKELC